MRRKRRHFFGQASASSFRACLWKNRHMVRSYPMVVVSGKGSVAPSDQR
jgi:hypothetical protein